MVLIPIRAPLVSLTITIISVITELAFLAAALSFLRYRTCRRLEKNLRVTVRAQHRYVLAVTLFAMLAFVTLETVTSVFSDPQRREVIDILPCVRNVLGATEDELPLQSEAVHFACTDIDGTTITHFEGNFSISSGSITCAPQPMYSYTIGKNVTLSATGSTFSCIERVCAHVAVNNDTLFISGLQVEGSQEINYLPTFMDPAEVSQLNLTFMAATLADLYTNDVTEEGEVRRRALLGSREGECPFVRDDGPATTIPLGVIIGACLVWASSLLFFIASLFFRKKIFFDITHPVHWARRVRHDVSRATGDNPELEMSTVGGETLITVTGYMRDEEDN